MKVNIKDKQINNSKGSDIIYLSNPEQVSMDNDWYGITNKEHFWMIWRFSLISDYLKLFHIENPSVLEIGCGNGVNMQMFKSNLDLVIDGCDLNESAVKKIKGVEGKKYVYDIFDNNAQMLNKYDLVLLLDVIEHIEDDGAFIETALKHLKKDGRIIINVPAHHTLFSKYDKKMGHKRRYNKNNIEVITKKLGLQIEYLSYWGLFMIPVVLLRKLIISFVKKDVAAIGFKPPHSIINKAFLLLMKIEKQLFSPPFTGTSLFAVIKK